LGAGFFSSMSTEMFAGSSTPSATTAMTAMTATTIIETTTQPCSG
jgi:hypothetical protein